MKYQHQAQPHHTRNIIALALLFSVGFFAYNFVTTQNVGAADALVSSDSGNSSTPLSPEQMALLNKIDSIKLDGAIFTDTTFLSLKDLTVDLGHEDAGRSNPFAPVGGVSSAPKTTKKTTR